MAIFGRWGGEPGSRSRMGDAQDVQDVRISGVRPIFFCCVAVQSPPTAIHAVALTARRTGSPSVAARRRPRGQATAPSTQPPLNRFHRTACRRSELFGNLRTRLQLRSFFPKFPNEVKFCHFVRKAPNALRKSAFCERSRFVESTADIASEMRLSEVSSVVSFVPGGLSEIAILVKN